MLRAVHGMLNACADGARRLRLLPPWQDSSGLPLRDFVSLCEKNLWLRSSVAGKLRPTDRSRMPPTDNNASDTDRTDKTSYAPFVFVDEGAHRSLILSDQHMEVKFPIFDEKAGDGWSGNGYDWQSVAQVIVAERLPEFASELSFDSEAGMFAATGSRAALEKLGTAMQSAFRDDAALRDVLSRAELD